MQNDNPLWMPEIGLGIGTEIGTFGGVTREWLYWYDRFGNRYSTPEEGEREAQLRRQQAELEREQERLAREQAVLEREQERLAREQAVLEREQERQARELAERQAQIERQRAEQLAARLQELGIDPDRL